MSPSAPAATEPRAGSASASAGTPPTSRAGVFLAVLGLMAVACLPLSRVFVGTAWVRPVAGAVLIALGLGWGVCQALGHRRGRGVMAALASLAGWAVFVSLVFAPQTLVRGVVPTFDSARALWGFALLGMELIRQQTSPVVPEPALVLLTVSGVWAVTLVAVHAALVRRAGLSAVLAALVLFAVPLALAPDDGGSTFAVVTFLAAAALLLLLTGRGDLTRWAGHSGTRAITQPGAARRGGVWSAGSLAAAVAIATGVWLSDTLPGSGDPPLYELRGRGGTTVTSNPIVGLRPSLTAQDEAPVLSVTSPRPVYLRTTALDVYDDAERWTTDRIRGAPVEGARLPAEVEMSVTDELAVDVEVIDLAGVLVPVPYPPAEVAGPTADSFQFDARNATVTLDPGTELEPGDTYRVTATVPTPEPERLDAVEGLAPDSSLTELPANVPDDVVELAARIVADAGASTPFRQAIAIQEELRTWTYSVDPPQGHDGEAMQAFIDNRMGYCEQFAGTMAVMLRTLDIPARVAVGFTPGEMADVEQNRWEVSNRNAHAWVEVLFPGYGWLAFEPTPRDDGNVLVPSTATLAPTDTQAGEVAASEEPTDSVPDAQTVPQTEPGALRGTPTPETSQQQAQESAGAGGLWGRGRRLGVGVAVAVAVALLVGGAVAVSRRPASEGPQQRVRRARLRAERLGRGLGLHPSPADTDAEYLERVGARIGPPAARAASVLSVESARARYAAGAVDDDAGQRAERAVAAMESGLDRGRLGRAALTARGAVGRLARAARVGAGS